MDIVINNIIKDQNHFEERLKEIGLDNVYSNEMNDPEVLASVTELVLEGLRFTDPPILGRKDGNYVYTQ